MDIWQNDHIQNIEGIRDLQMTEVEDDNGQSHFVQSTSDRELN